MIASALCIVVGTALVSIPVQRFTLRWQHTVEKVLWEEDYVVAGEWLYLVSARVRGSGAGMEPPPEARLVDGWFQWRPARAPLPELVLGNSGVAGEWRLCQDSQCRTLSEIFERPIGADVIKISVCDH